MLSFFPMQYKLKAIMMVRLLHLYFITLSTHSNGVNISTKAEISRMRIKHAVFLNGCLNQLCF